MPHMEPFWLSGHTPGVGSSDSDFVLLWGWVLTAVKCIASNALGGIIGGIFYFYFYIFIINQVVILII